MRTKGNVMRFKPLRNRTVEERFWEKVDKKGDNECWEWQGAKSGGGYEYFGKCPTKRAHRVSYELTNGIIEEGLWVLHKCDNPARVNPNHLFLGDRSDNTRDAAKKGRILGEKAGGSKLSDLQVREIKDMWKTSVYTQRGLAKLFGVHQGTICRIINSNSWGHL